ncbi:hypothetical protein AMTR_s00118p00065230 [Amborella trichopoda]|uniref:Uncharacterized protein n=1 Tax=Amborella trichopoda TaxID=13333 RepID=W1NQR7_AMBTC|nr:hypothetical protein AMTR_s00118p00065230 [Amborella trichopoda]
MHVGESSSEHKASHLMTLVLESGAPLPNAQPCVSVGPMALTSSIPDVGDLTVRHMIRASLQGLRECAPLDLKRGIEAFRVCMAILEAVHPEGEISVQLRQLLEALMCWGSAAFLSGTAMSQVLDAHIASFQEKLTRECTSLRSCEE